MAAYTPRAREQIAQGKSAGFAWRAAVQACAALLRKVTDLLEDSVADMAIAGEAQRIAELIVGAPPSVIARTKALQ